MWKKRLGSTRECRLHYMYTCYWTQMNYAAIICSLMIRERQAFLSWSRQWEHHIYNVFIDEVFSLRLNQTLAHSFFSFFSFLSTLNWSSFAFMLVSRIFRSCFLLSPNRSTSMFKTMALWPYLIEWEYRVCIGWISRAQQSHRDRWQNADWKTSCQLHHPF